MSTRPSNNLFAALIFILLGFICRTHADALDTWFVRASGVSNRLTSAAYGQGSFVAVGQDGMVVNSTNGSTWASQSFHFSLDFNYVSYGGGMFLATTPFPPLTNIYASFNATNWLGFYSGSSVSLYGAGYANGFYFTGGGYTRLLTATNMDLSCVGLLTNCNWSIRHTGGDNPFAGVGGVAYGNGVYVAPAYRCVLTSTDAMTWTSNFVAAIAGATPHIAYGNGIFVAAGGGTVLVATSTDGKAWTARAVSPSPSSDVTYGSGMFALVGDQGSIFTSSDGITWKKRTSPVTTNLRGVCYGNGTFLIVGDNGTILQSDIMPPRITATKPPDGSGILLTVTGQIDRSYHVQVISNLMDSNWTDVTAFTNTLDETQFFDTDATNYSQRFYRVVSP